MIESSKTWQDLAVLAYSGFSSTPLARICPALLIPQA
jgi:hypothetical protein